MRLEPLVPPDLTEAQRKLYESITGGKRATGPQHFPLTDPRGALVGPFGVMLHEPGIGRALQDLGSTVRYDTDMGDRLREIAILAVAAATTCEFERYAHERVGLACGLTRHELDQLAAGTFEGVDLIEASAHDLCRRLAVGAAQLDDADYQQFRDALGEPLMIDLVVLVGYYVTLANLLAVFDVQAPPD